MTEHEIPDSPDFEDNPLWYYLQRARENDPGIVCMKCLGPLTRAERAREVSYCAGCEAEFRAAKPTEDTGTSNQGSNDHG